MNELKIHLGNPQQQTMEAFASILSSGLRGVSFDALQTLSGPAGRRQVAELAQRMSEIAAAVAAELDRAEWCPICQGITGNPRNSPTGGCPLCGRR